MLRSSVCRTRWRRRASGLGLRYACRSAWLWRYALNVVVRRVQLRGYNLIPFHFDKQILMLTNIVLTVLCGSPPSAAHVFVACWLLCQMCHTQQGH